MKRILLLLTIVLVSFSARSSHIMGGEITWECQGTQFVFEMKIYRDCNGASLTGNQSLDVWNHPSLSSIPMPEVARNDISPVCFDPNQVNTCADGNGANPIPGLVEEVIYRSAPITIAGTPPANGWAFTWDLCCRNGAVDNYLQPNGSAVSGAGHTLRAVMYAYTPPGNTIPNNTNPCYDNSPKFAERPASVLCTGYPWVYNQVAEDAEFDSLVYSFDEPLDDLGFGGIYNPPANPQALIPNGANGYTAANPYPGPAQNPLNQPTTLNPVTGEVAFENYTSGAFVIVVRVDAYKCGQLVAQIWRDFQVTFLGACTGGNLPPAPSVTGGLTSVGNNVWTDTVFAGDFVTFNLQASDFDLNPGGIGQNVTLNAIGQQFGTGYTSATGGCLQPPCATLSPAPPITVAFGVGSTLSWQTDCAHLSANAGCNTTSNTYTFLLKAIDDACPAPASLFATFSITVLPGTAERPNMKCLAVAPGGDITLTWEAPQDTGFDFINYQIYQSNNPAGPFAPIDSVIDWGTTSFTHVGAPAQSYYFVTAKAGCGFESAPSDTISPIELDVTSASAGGVAILDWNAPMDPMPSSSTLQYLVYREYPPGNWTLLDSTTALTFNDTIDLCDEFINYRIEIVDTAVGCTSVSTIDGDQFGDITAPNALVMDSASVNIDNNFATTGWPISGAGDFEAYIIYIFDAATNGWIPIDTIFDVNQNEYINLLSNAANEPETYAVAVLDSCGNRSPISNEHTTIHLQADLDACIQEVNMDWTDYFGFTVDSYSVILSVDGGPETTLATYGPSVNDHTHDNLVPFSTYCYYILAEGPNGEVSRSNQVCIFANLPTAPQFQYTNFVTVDLLQEYVLLSTYYDDMADIGYFSIERSNFPAGPYSQIGTTQLTPGVNPFQYVDNQANYNQQPFWYRVIAIDTCGQEAFVADSSNTIHLTVSALSGLINELNWNEYNYWLGDVDSYDIYRYTTQNNNPVLIGSVDGSTTTYSDDLNVSMAEGDGIGTYCYFVTANEGPGNTYGFQETSTSNSDCATQTPRLFMPNAFTPNGDDKNEYFGPESIFIDQMPYEMFIYNRWGEEIFYTTDVYEGWDGTIRGKDAPMATYLYYVRYTNLDGETIEEQGTFQLIR